MNAKLDKFKSGWVGFSLAFSKKEIELLLLRFDELTSGKINHFHLRNDDFSSDEGVADIEISLVGDNEENNMIID